MSTTKKLIILIIVGRYHYVFSVALSAIIPLHHPVVSAARRHFYSRAIRSLGVKATDVIAHKSDEIVQVLLAEMESNSASEAPLIAMEELARINPSVLVPKIASLAAQKMEDRTLMVSFNDYQTYLTKEGELYDKSLTESFRKDGSDSTNIKRENKAYSYKEQVRV